MQVADLLRHVLNFGLPGRLTLLIAILRDLPYLLKTHELLQVSSATVAAAAAAAAAAAGVTLCVEKL